MGDAKLVMSRWRNNLHQPVRSVEFPFESFLMFMRLLHLKWVEITANGRLFTVCWSSHEAQVCRVEQFLIQSSQSHCHPFLLNVASLAACCSLLMEISPPSSSSLPVLLLCSPFVVLLPPYHFHFAPFKSICRASSLAHSVKLIDSKPSLRALHSLPLSLYCKSTTDSEEADRGEKQKGVIIECISGRQAHWFLSARKSISL